jgi:transglutaminase-like putative cysteine protease
MKAEKWLVCLQAFLLAFAIAFGGCGCLVTGFDLPVTSLGTLALILGCCAALGAVILRVRRGGMILACLTALAAGVLWYDGRVGKQFLSILQDISVIYDRAYGWGALHLGVPRGQVDLAVAVLGCAVALAVVRTVSQGQWAWPTVIIGLIPLAACLVVTDMIPDPGFLYLLILGLALLCLTSALRQRSHREGSRLAVFAALPAALALGILFWMFPKEDFADPAEDLGDRFFHWVSEMEQSVSGTASTGPGTTQSRVERLDTLGDRRLRTTPVMDITAEQGGTLYLRGQDFDFYDGHSWISSLGREEDFPLNDESGFFIGDTLGDVEIRLRSAVGIRYLPYYPQPAVILSGGLPLESPELSDYTVTRRVLPDDWKQIVASLEVQQPGSRYYDHMPERYRALPLIAREGAKQLLETILTDEQSATEKADAIAAFVRNSAQYDLSPGTMPSNETDFALWFLEDSDKGYCIHFATATVVLLRAAGVDARYVTGYMARVPAGKTVTVTADQAHAWAEYYEPRLGMWIVLESTPASGGADLPTEPSIPQPGMETTPAPPTSPQATQPQPTEPVEKSPEGGNSGWLWFLPAALIPVLLWGQWFLRREVNRRRLARGTANRRALAIWTVLTRCCRLVKLTPSPEAEALACKAFFSQHTLTQRELAVLRQELARTTEALMALPWYRRLAYRFLLGL